MHSAKNTRWKNDLKEKKNLNKEMEMTTKTRVGRQTKLHAKQDTEGCAKLDLKSKLHQFWACLTEITPFKPPGGLQ